MRVAVLGGTGSFGRALAARLVALGEDDVVIGSRDAERARGDGARARRRASTGATNDDAVRGADLVVLAVKADAALDTARAVARRARRHAAALRGERDRVPRRASARFPIPMRAASPSASRTSSPAPVAAGLHSIAAANLDDAPPDEDALICGDDPAAKELALELAGKLVAGRALDAGPLASARALEGLTAVIVNLNRRYKAHAGVRITGVPTDADDRAHPRARPAGDPAGRRPRRADRRRSVELEDRDVVVVAQKVVSKAEGRRRRARRIEPSEQARELAGDERDPRELEAILREAKRIVRERGAARDRRDPPRIRLRVGRRRPFERARAGNARAPARRPRRERAAPARRGFASSPGADVGVIVTDSFGRPFRQGTTDVAIGVAGVPAIIDLRGTLDRIGYELRSSRVAVADEIAGAADLARGKAERRAGGGRPRPASSSGDAGTGAGVRDRARARSVPLGSTPGSRSLTLSSPLPRRGPQRLATVSAVVRWATRPGLAGVTSQAELRLLGPWRTTIDVRSLSLRRLASRSTACQSPCPGRRRWRAARRRRRPGAAGRSARARRSARCARSPTTIAASPGRTSVPRASARTPTLVLVPPQRRPGVPALDGRRLGRSAPTPPSARALATLHRRLAVRFPPPPARHAVAATRRAPTASGSTLSLAQDLPGPGHAGASLRAARGDRRRTLRLWQERSAAAALAVARYARRAPRSDRDLAARRVPVHPPLRGHLDVEHRQRLLRRAADGPRVPCSATGATSSAAGARPTTGPSGRSSRRRPGRYDSRPRLHARGRTRRALCGLL